MEIAGEAEVLETRSLLPQFNGDRGLAPADSHHDLDRLLFLGHALFLDLYSDEIHGMNHWTGMS